MSYIPPSPPAPINVEAALRLDDVWPKLLVVDGYLALLRDRVLARYGEEVPNEPPYDTFVGLGRGYPQSIEREDSARGPRYRHWFTSTDGAHDVNTSELLVPRDGRVAQVVDMDNLQRVVVVDSMAKAVARINREDAAKHHRMYRPLTATEVLDEITSAQANAMPGEDVSPAGIILSAEPRVWLEIAADPAVDERILHGLTLHTTWLPLARVLARNPNLAPHSLAHLSNLAPWDVATNPALPLLHLSLGDRVWSVIDERTRAAFDAWSAAGLL